jgi:hypothetical protein
MCVPWQCRPPRPWISQSPRVVGAVLVSPEVGSLGKHPNRRPNSPCVLLLCPISMTYSNTEYYTKSPFGVLYLPCTRQKKMCWYIHLLFSSIPLQRWPTLSYCTKCTSAWGLLFVILRRQRGQYRPLSGGAQLLNCMLQVGHTWAKTASYLGFGCFSLGLLGCHSGGIVCCSQKKRWHRSFVCFWRWDGYF